jgi:hypothetical protein
MSTEDDNEIGLEYLNSIFRSYTNLLEHHTGVTYFNI